MSRTPRDEAVARLAARELEEVPPDGPVLVVGDPRDEVAEAAAAFGVPVDRWERRARKGRAATTWPVAGAYRLVAIRLPRAKDELEMAVHAAAAVLEPGGGLRVYGANDEGIRSAGERVEPLFGRVGTLAVGGHGRVLGAVRPATLAGLRGALGDWREVGEIVLAGARRRWVSYPGVFAAGRLDAGTELLLEHLPRVEEGERVLDYGGGSGPLAAGVLAARPGARLTLLEIDAVAAEAARENVPGAHVVVGDGWGALPGGAPFDVVVANPPYHRGKEESLAGVADLLGGAAAGLRPGGVLRMVVQRRLRIEDLLAGWPGAGAVVADRGVHRIWEARKAGAGDPRDGAAAGRIHAGRSGPAGPAAV